ncbi:MAG: hypothetical protein ACE5KM_08180 [Planctomycetaceae bacterium]
MFRETTDGDCNGIEALVCAGAPPVSPLSQRKNAGGGLSRGLHERIIAEAMSARLASARQSRRGRAGIVLGVSLAMALFVGRQPAPFAIQPDAVVFSFVLEKIENSLTRDSAATVSALTCGPDHLDWHQVELMSRLRRCQARTLRSAFGS